MAATASCPLASARGSEFRTPHASKGSVDLSGSFKPRLTAWLPHRLGASCYCTHAARPLWNTGSMSDTAVSQFMALLCGADGAAEALTDDALLRTWGAEDLAGHRPAARVARALANEWATLSEPIVAEHSRTLAPDRAVIEFRIHTTDGLQFRKQERCAVIGIAGERISTIDMYTGPWTPGGPRDDWRAPAGMTDDQVMEFLSCLGWDHYMRRTVSTNHDSWTSNRRALFGSGEAHPGANFLMRARFGDAEADAGIAEIIEWHQRQDIGFSWTVGPWDRPLDLAERLVAKGLMRAGDQALMARVGLDAQEIPLNPEIEVRRIGPEDTDLMDAALEITAIAFKWTPLMVENERPDWYHANRDSEMRKRQLAFVALLDGKPVAEAILNLRSGVAYLGGAATLPEVRSRRIYSTMLRHRLLAAHEMGYNLAVLHAEPMSRRVVSRYGFRTFAMFDVYGWMPVMDPAVIATLVQDD